MYAIWFFVWPEPALGIDYVGGRLGRHVLEEELMQALTRKNK